MTSNAMIAKIHIAKKDLGLDDATYRSIIKQVTGKDSCRNCNIVQLEKIIDFMKSKGWKSQKPKKDYRDGPSELIKKIYVLWADLRERGAIKSDEKNALDKFVKKHTKIDSVQWLGDGDAIKIIEIMKKWIRRLEDV